MPVCAPFVFLGNVTP